MRSARRSSDSIEYGVSLFGTITAVSSGVNTRASLEISLNGALNWPESRFTAMSYIAA
jgi:hypothetical protein